MAGRVRDIAFKKSAIRVEGLANAARVLEEIPLLAGAVLGDAVEAGGQPIRETAEQLAPEDTGQLRESIIVEDAQVLGPHGARTKVGHASEAWYGMFPELGTGRGWRNGAHPFLRPAADERFEDAVEAIVDEIRDSIL